MAGQPNSVYCHVDIPGIGEISCYSGGLYRGVWTRRLDAFAREGMRPTNDAPDRTSAPRTTAGGAAARPRMAQPIDTSTWRPGFRGIVRS